MAAAEYNTMLGQVETAIGNAKTQLSNALDAIIAYDSSDSQEEASNCADMIRTYSDLIATIVITQGRYQSLAVDEQEGAE